MKKLKKGMVIRFKKDIGNPSKRNWIILPVTKKELKRGINADSVGFYAFGGLWYGRNPMKTRCYGKIQCIDGDFETIHGSLLGLTVNEIQTLVD